MATDVEVARAFDVLSAGIDESLLSKALDVIGLFQREKKEEDKTTKLMADFSNEEESFNELQSGLEQTRLATYTLDPFKETVLDRSMLGDKYDKSRLLMTKNKLKEARKKINGGTAGRGWFNLPKGKSDAESAQHFFMMKNRNHLFPGRNYKTYEGAPTFYQFGTVVAGKQEFFSARMEKKFKNKTIAQELLADADYQKKIKQKFAKIQRQKSNVRVLGGAPFRPHRERKSKGTSFSYAN
mmetsp:Transcript_296/g.570  ORF Transcript_296/g.570 Transcript_296/m.570 type:complete len:240 (-) Transcript_296:155-874(-)